MHCEHVYLKKITSLSIKTRLHDLFSLYNKSLTVKQTQLQQGGKCSYDHKGEQTSTTTHQPDCRTKSQAGCHSNASHGVIVCVT